MNAIKRFLAALLVVSWPAAAQDQPEPTGSTQGSLELGFWTASLSGSPDLASKFDPTERSRPLGALVLELQRPGGNLRLSSRALDGNAQRHDLEFDVGRALRSSTTYTRFLNRLGHDPLTNLESASRNGRIVWSTDTDPGREYVLENGLLEHRTELQPPGLSALTLGLTYRDQRRSGAHQSLTIAHCDTCHVYSQTHDISEKLREGGADAKVAWLKGYISGAFTHRQLRQDGPELGLTYDRGLQPELRTAIFDNRLIFDALQGSQVVDHLQDVNRNSGRLDLVLHDLLGFRISANGAWSSTENRFTGLQADYQGYSLATSRVFRKKLTLRVRGRAYTASSDDFFVDTVERVGSAGPQAGRTYRQIYGFDPDYRRLSTLNRDVYESGTELAWKVGKKAGTVRALWNFQSVERHNFEVAPGSRTTTTNVVGLAWRPSPAKGLKVSADYRHGFVDNPLMLVNGACSTIPAIGPLASPLAPGSIQYFQVHDSRVADTTAVPRSWNELRLSTTYSRAKVALTGTYRLWDGVNQAGDMTDWSRTSHVATSTLWVAPEARWDAFVAYSFQRADLGSHVCVPVFDG